MTGRTKPRLLRLVLLIAAELAVSGCVQKMNVDPKYEPLTESDFFTDGQSSRPLPAGTVSRGNIRFADPHLYQGRIGNVWADSFPFPVTAEVMARGRQRYNIFCSPCHGYTGDGQGMIVQRGLRGPVSFHQEKFLNYPAGYFFDVITHGRGAMYPYASRIPVSDRWAIIAYIRALQLSQNARFTDAPPNIRQQLEGAP